MTPEELLTKGLKELRIEASDSQVSAFMLYMSELKRWQKAYSLTSLKKEEDIIVKHFLDSLLFLKFLEGHTASVADVGSGAGFPGIPVKIMRPDIYVYLIEPSRKKSAFLRHIIKLLNLNDIEVLEKRVEEVKGLTVDASLTRALYTVKEFHKKSRHLVKEGGILILSKGPAVEVELKDMNIPYRHEVIPLPLSDIKRHFIIIEKGIARG